jgi:methionyl-tRNA synthetase
MTSIGNPTTSVSNQLEPKYGNLDEGTQTTDGKKKKRGSPCEAICNQNKTLQTLLFDKIQKSCGRTSRLQSTALVFFRWGDAELDHFTEWILLVG